MIFFHTKFRMLLDWTASRIQFHQTSLTNVAKFLLLQVFLNIRHKLFEFQTFMNQTQIIILQTLLYTLQTHIIYIIRPTNRAPNKPAWPGPNWPKMPILGQIWSFWGKKSFFLLEKTKVLLPT